MPLTARVNDKIIETPFVSEEEWGEIVSLSRRGKASIVMTCCGKKGYPRVSPAGLQHFYHSRKSDECQGHGESAEHIYLKTEIARACQEAGWAVQLEACGPIGEHGNPIYRVDVLASNGDQKIAFEAQWSPQDGETFEARQQRYKENGLKGLWLFRGANELPASPDLPIFEIVDSNNGVPELLINGQLLSVKEFVSLYLAGEIKFAPITIAKLRISFAAMECWKCRYDSHIYIVSQVSRCGHKIYGLLEPDSQAAHLPVSTSFEPRIIDLLPSEIDLLNAGLRIGIIEGSNGYKSFGCFSCDARFAPHYVISAFYDRDDSLPVFEYELPLYHTPLDGDYPESLSDLREDLLLERHWCLPKDGESYCINEDNDKERAERLIEARRNLYRRAAATVNKAEGERKAWREEHKEEIALREDTERREMEARALARQQKKEIQDAKKAYRKWAEQPAGLPSALAVTLPGDVAIAMPSWRFHQIIFAEFIQDRIGLPFDAQEVAALFHDRQTEDSFDSILRATNAYLGFLVSEGYLGRVSDNNYQVMRDFKDPSCLEDAGLAPREFVTH